MNEIPSIPKVTLKADKVTLRPLERGDTEALHQAILESFEDLHPWMSWCHEGYTLQETQSWVNSQPGLWRNGIEYNLAILDPADGSLLGGAGLNHLIPTYRMANLGYWVRSSRAGEGIAGSAALLVAQFGFEHLGLTRAEIVVSAGNVRSQRVAQKIGARREGMLRNRILVRGELHDAVMYSLIPGDLEPTG